MSDLAIRVDNISKQYKIGTGVRHDSLKDLLTHRFNELFGRNSNFPVGNSQADYIWALKDVSFEVKQGETLGIIGSNGAGKSTLLKILSRITEPTTGRVEVFGKVASLLEVGVGFYRELTGRENVYLNGAILGMTKAEIDRKFDEMVDFSGVEKFIDTPVKHYSSGMYVRLAFAVAAHLEPEILIVDEVLAVGDAAFQKKCLGKMGEVAKSGRTILFVSHDMAAVENLCKRTIILKDGHIVCVDDARAAVTTYLNQELSSLASTFLEDQSYRTGNGRIRLTSFHVEDKAGNRLGVARSGQDIVLVFGFACTDGNVLGNVTVGFGIHLDSINTKALAIHYTPYTAQDFELIPLEGEFRCHIPRLPFAPGRYFIGARVEVNGVEADWPRNGAGFVDVERGDFFGTGRMVGNRGHAPVLLIGEWSVKALTQPKCGLGL